MQGSESYQPYGSIWDNQKRDKNGATIMAVALTAMVLGTRLISLMKTSKIATQLWHLMTMTIPL